MLDFGEILIRENSSPESLRRGREYYRQGAVTSLIQRGQDLVAEVSGSQFTPYDVRIVFDEAGLVEASCSCPYEWGGCCKHIVAALFAGIHEPETVRASPALEDVLSGLDLEQLKNVMLRLAECDSHLADAIEREASLLQTPSPSGARRATVDANSIRCQVHSIIRSLQYMRPSEAYWHVGGIVDEVRRVLDGAWDFIEAQEGRGALVVVDAITDEYMEAWEFLDDSDGYVGDFFHDLGAAWTEALLTAELTLREREEWCGKLDARRKELEMYAGGEAFDAALLAVEQGWDHPPLLRVLEGGVPKQEEYYDHDLAVARLGVLERQGRHEEYLRLSDYAGQLSRHAVMLVRLHRTEEAVEYSLKRLRYAEEALAVAESLWEHEELERALRIGEYGLSLEGRKAPLAVWVRDLASGTDQPDRALQPAGIAFRGDPSLASYLLVRDLAGEGWLEYRSTLLDHLRRDKSYHPVGHVEVFLHEGLVQDAIAAVERSPDGALLERVADAAVESHPDWVIGTCRRQAEEIMDRGKSGYYGRAIDWLAKVKAAYLVAGRGDEWRTYLGELVDRHQRKYKLRPMLEDLAK